MLSELAREVLGSRVLRLLEYESSTTSDGGLENQSAVTKQSAGARQSVSLRALEFQPS